MEIESQPCIRKKIVINGENFYLLIGKDFLQCTVPRENDPNQSDVRNMVEQICEAVSEVRKFYNVQEKGG